MNIKKAFALTLKAVRKARGLTQEDFSDISSRTYVSSLERGIKSPTLEKMDDLANAMGIHLVTLILLTCSQYGQSTEEIVELVRQQLKDLQQ